MSKTTDKPIIAYKGFDKDFKCRDFQYEVGKTYEHDGDVQACRSGFHACKHPLNVLSYYSPNASRFAEVELSGTTHSDGDDTKIAAAKITITAEIQLNELATRAVKWVFDRANWTDAKTCDGDNEGATASGDWGAATASGYQGAATASGRWGAATASGDQGAATASGRWGAATASGYQGAATASGDWGAATASGTQGAATALGKNTAAMASGYGGKASGKEGCALFLTERNDDYKIIATWSGIVGQKGIKPDTFYKLKNGEPVAVQ